MLTEICDIKDLTGGRHRQSGVRSARLFCPLICPPMRPSAAGNTPVYRGLALGCRGLQIRSGVTRVALGGFDSHTFPPITTNTLTIICVSVRRRLFCFSYYRNKRGALHLWTHTWTKPTSRIKIKPQITSRFVERARQT